LFHQKQLKINVMETSSKTKWSIDPSHSEISFKAKHLMITNVKGVFKEFEGTVYTSGNNFLTSEIEFKMNPASVDTGAPDRDGHLKSADFFDVENFKEVTFKGSSVVKTYDENYTLTGDLTIKGVTQKVKLDVEFGGVMKDPWGNEKAGYAISGKINRKDFGLTWNAALETGGVLVSEEIKISCEVQLLKQPN
jgi:polyisoprenoid-binding protein YceI